MKYVGAYPLAQGRALDRPLVEAYKTALHPNPSFENVTAGAPDDWDFFWQTGGSVAVNSSDTVAGAKSITVSTASGTSQSQVGISDPFDVTGGDTIAASAWARKVSGSPRISLLLFTGPASAPSPTFFDGKSWVQESDPETLPATYTPFERVFVVPKDHEVARIGFRTLATATEATSVRVDLTSSERRGVGSVQGAGWQTPTYSTNWADLGTGFAPLRFQRDSTGRVHVEGYVLRSSSTSSANATIATIGADYAPAYSLVVGTLANASGTLSATQVVLNPVGELVASLATPSGTALWVSADYYTD